MKYLAFRNRKRKWKEGRNNKRWKNRQKEEIIRNGKRDGRKKEVII